MFQLTTYAWSSAHDDGRHFKPSAISDQEVHHISGEKLKSHEASEGSVNWLRAGIGYGP